MNFNQAVESIKRVDSKKVTYLPFDEAWNLICDIGLTPLFDYIRGVRVLSHGEKLFNNVSFMGVYSIIYDLCTQKGEYEFSEKVYNAQFKISEDFFKELCEIIKSHKDEIVFVKSYINIWNLFETVYMKWMHQFFIYVQRFYINTNHLSDIKTQLTLQFKQHVFEPCKDRLMNYISTEINKMREENGLVVNDPPLKSVMNVFTNLVLKDDTTMYSMYFEPYLYEFSRNYYIGKVSQWRSATGNIEYCHVVHQFKTKEEDRMRKYFQPSSFKNLINIYIEQTVKNIHREILLHDDHGLSFILKNQRWDDLYVLYDIMSLIPNNEGVKDFSTIYGEHVANEFSGNLISLKNEPGIFNEASAKFLEIYELYQEIVKNRLNNHQLFQEALRNTTKTSVNRIYEHFKFYDAFPAYLDTMMKMAGDKSKSTPVEIGVLIKKVIEIVNFIGDKDIFIENCRIHMAKRMYDNKCVDEDNERELISEIKANFGQSYVLKMVGMLNDFANAKVFIGEFKSSPHNNIPFDFNASVYTRTHWPSLPRTEIALPSQISSAIGSFKQYYDEIHTKRELQWNFTVGKMIVRVEFANKQIHELNLNVIQGIIFYLFQRRNVEHTVQTIVDTTHISKDFVKRALHSMACRKIKILNKTGHPEEIQDSDVFTFNFNFTFPRRIVPVPCPPFEERNVQETVQEDRTHQIEAAIVRIMKIKKTYEHGSLIVDVINQLRMFNPEPKIIKKRIEALIEKEYLERHREKPNVYIYMA